MIYKPSMLDKFKDFVTGIGNNANELESTQNELESHKADIAYSGIITANQSSINGDINYYKSYGVVTISTGGSNSLLTQELAGWGSVDVFTLPEGFRTNTELTVPLQFDNNNSAAVLRVLSNGIVRITSRQSTPIPTSGSAATFRGSITFPSVQ